MCRALPTCTRYFQYTEEDSSFILLLLQKYSSWHYFTWELSCLIFWHFRHLYATPKVTKYQRCDFTIQIHQITIKIDKINVNLLFECVKIVEFNFNSHVFHVMYQETRFLNQDACFLNQEGRRQFLISFVSKRDWNTKICKAPWKIPPILAHSRARQGRERNRRTCEKNHSISTRRSWHIAS